MWNVQVLTAGFEIGCAVLVYAQSFVSYYLHSVENEGFGDYTKKWQ